MPLRTSLLAVLALCAFGPTAVAAQTSAAHAWDMTGTKKIFMHTREGADIPLGTVDFKRAGKDVDYTLSIDTSKLKTFFLSMRDFKCAEGAEIQCFVPYPYDHPHVIKNGDLTWLEHDLLFFYKKPNDYGANLQNGLYYAMKVTDHGLVGTPQAIDLNKIAAPPDDKTAPPYPPSERDDIPAGSRWIDSLRIQ